jgi:hypothetical protein
MAKYLNVSDLPIVLNDVEILSTKKQSYPSKTPGKPDFVTTKVEANFPSFSVGHDGNAVPSKGLFSFDIDDDVVCPPGKRNLLVAVDSYMSKGAFKVALRIRKVLK